MLMTDVTITSPLRLKSKGASPATTAAAESDKVFPRDARFEPCLVRPIITCLQLRARPKSTNANIRRRISVATIANSNAAWPDLFAMTFVPTESCRDAAISLLPYFVLAGGKGSFLNVALDVKVYAPFGKNCPTKGVISFRLLVSETVTVSPGPPALPLPPAKIEI